MKNIFENILFGVAREDHKIEASLIEKNNYKNLLTVCSGGCVPLSLKTIFPDLNVVAYDINPNQIDHCKKKINAVLRKDFSSLNINQFGDQLLNQSGKFEEMFQSLRKSFIKNVTEDKTIKFFFSSATSDKERQKTSTRWNNHENIKIPFQDTFSDVKIEKVFGNHATKQGQPGSYVSYFQKKIMRALLKEKSHDNPFLQHIFLGYYKSKNAFPYMDSKLSPTIQFFEGNVCDVPNFNGFDIISLSNLFDWSDESFIIRCVRKLSNIKPGSSILLRQLNNHKDWSLFFGEGFKEDKAFDKYWQEKDRSFFYDHFRLFVKV
tara:strand:- start:412 stop:1371 length:960 start_codon:yes stop_codon:yes gene_type:complete